MTKILKDFYKLVREESLKTAIGRNELTHAMKCNNIDIIFISSEYMSGEVFDPIVPKIVQYCKTNDIDLIEVPIDTPKGKEFMQYYFGMTAILKEDKTDYWL